MALADSPVSRDAKAVASSSGKFFMLVTPIDATRRSWIWSVYRMENVGTFKEVWSSDGAYSSDIFLADDGVTVACVETQPYGHAPKDDILVAIFRQGKLVQAHRAQDLIADLKSLPQSTSHYRWLADGTRPLISNGRLLFETVEGVRFEVALASGQLTRSDR